MKKTGKKIIVILGPTASGKSDLAVKIAKSALGGNGEIISADSRQVYKGLNIGTGKITKKEMKGIPHHLLDVVSPKKIFTVIDFKKRAEKAIKDISSRGKIPIICGGAGFYIQAITGGIDIPEIEPNWELRKKLEKKSAEQLFKMLQKMDSSRAKTIDPKNPRRLIRAIEIAKDLGKIPKASSQSEVISSQTLYIGIKLTEEKLREKIEKRIKQMISSGLVKETEKIKKSGLTWKRIYELGFEYKYPAMFLRKKFHPAERGKDEMIERMIIENIRYAKRQMVWFKKYAKETKWIKTTKGETRLLLESKKLIKKFL